MKKIGWPVEHPNDKRACVVCDAKPVLLGPTEHPDAGRCMRCKAPYFFKAEGPEGEILQQFDSALPPNLVEHARNAWHDQHIKIELAPFFATDTTAPTAFEAYLEKHAQAELQGDVYQPVAWLEVWQVETTGHGNCWVRVVPMPDRNDLESSTEYGEIALDADNMPPGTTITINRPAVAEAAE